ncbi:Uncharacterised protein [Vibrio cholerae]|nr:Uncharacterised protein [Vibrio cholerae]CSI72297.1 Uncharacterised protein [Vibrio cholerae]
MLARHAPHRSALDQQPVDPIDVKSNPVGRSLGIDP